MTRKPAASRRRATFRYIMPQASQNVAWKWGQLAHIGNDISCEKPNLHENTRNKKSNIEAMWILSCVAKKDISSSVYEIRTENIIILTAGGTVPGGIFVAAPEPKSVSKNGVQSQKPLTVSTQQSAWPSTGTRITCGQQCTSASRLVAGSR